MLTAGLLIVGGMVALVVGAELLVRGASRLASLAGVSSLVIGLTVVAFGTSAPESAVSVKASLEGQADIAVGNVVGSNIFNVLFILGVSALLSPLVVSSQLIRWEVPLMIATSLLMLLVGWDGRISRIEGVFLFSGILIYTVWTIRKSRRERAAIKAEYEQEFDDPPLLGGGLTWQLVLVVGGLALLVLGANWLVEGAVDIARVLGMSELLIGLTIVAAGTSLPEVATSVLATLRGERDIAVGNVVGSSIFNVLCVLGLSSAVSSDGVAVSATALQFDIPVMIAVAVACLPIFFTGHLIARWEGVVFLGYYVAYTTYLVLDATQSTFSRTLEVIMLGFVIPLTVITLMVAVVRSLREKPVPANSEIQS